MTLTTVAVWSFVFIWSTGFIIARQIADHADPNLFLTARFGLVALLFAVYCFVRGATWPNTLVSMKLIGVGTLLSGVYLGLGFWSVSEGLQPGVMALIGTLQPPLTAILAQRFFNESVTRWTFLGLAIGMLGVALAVSPTINGDTATGIKALPVTVLFAAVVSILAVTAGTLLHRTSIAEVEIAPACALQNVGGFATVALLALLLGESAFPLDGKTMGALIYAVLILSVTGYTLLIWLVRTGGATRSSSLLFLTPPLAGIMAWLFYDDQLSSIQLAGFAITLLGVWLSRK